MKKFLVVMVIAALTCMSSMAFAADITMGGSVEIMSRDYTNLDLTKSTKDGATDDPKYTLERVRINMDGKAGAVTGRISLENDFDTWGRLESNQGKTTIVTNVTPTDYTSTTQASRLGIREAWMLFPVADTGVFVKAGHMTLALGHGQFLSNMRYGSDAWVAYKDIDTLHLGFVNIKVGEGTNGISSDDTDAYALVAVNKFGDAVAGADLAIVRMNNRAANLQNIGLNYKGKVGPVALKAELDYQLGDASATTKYKGNLLYVNGSMDMSPVTVNFTLARGTGEDAATTDTEEFTNFLDTNGHYTLIYEYMINSAAGHKNLGFVNTTAISAGAMFAATKNVKIGADLWILQATEKTNLAGGTASSDAGTELDVKVLWKVADNVNWNWTLAYFKPGKVYQDAAGTVGKDAATGIQGLLTMTM